MSTETQPTNKRLEAIYHIEDNSVCLSELFYNKRTKTRYEFRVKSDGKTFILITHDEGKSGFEIFYPDSSMKTDEIIINFDKY